MNRLTLSEMEKVLQRTVQAMNARKLLQGLKSQVVLRPPAIPRDLERLTLALPFSLPPSYVDILRSHDGIDNFYGVKGKLLPCTYRFDFPDFDKEWERPHMFFFIVDNDWNAVAFDTKTRNTEGEMEVMEISENIDADRWPSLSDFLIGYMERVEGWLINERADRAEVDGD